MSEIMVPMRVLETYQADDGRRVEVFRKTKTIPFVQKKQNENDEEHEFSDIECVFVGVVHVLTKYGPNEIKFQIPDVTTVEDAFDKYYTYADEAVANLTQKIQEAQEKSRNKIVTAPASILNTFEQDEEEEDNGGLIIP